MKFNNRHINLEIEDIKTSYENLSHELKNIINRDLKTPTILSLKGVLLLHGNFPILKNLLNSEIEEEERKLYKDTKKMKKISNWLDLFVIIRQKTIKNLNMIITIILSLKEESLGEDLKNIKIIKDKLIGINAEINNISDVALLVSSIEKIFNDIEIFKDENVKICDIQIPEKIKELEQFNVKLKETILENISKYEKEISTLKEENKELEERILRNQMATAEEMEKITKENLILKKNTPTLNNDESEENLEEFQNALIEKDRKISNLTDDLKAANEIAEHLREELQNPKKTENKLREQLAETENKLSWLIGNAGQKEEDILKRDVDIADLQEALKDKISIEQNLKECIEKLNNDIKSLQKELNKSQQKGQIEPNIELESINEKKLESLKQIYELREAALKATSDSEKNRLYEENEELKKEIALLNEGIEKIKGQVDDTKAKNLGLNNEIFTLQKEIVELQKETVELQKEISKLKDEEEVDNEEFSDALAT